MTLETGPYTALITALCGAGSRRLPPFGANHGAHQPHRYSQWPCYSLCPSTGDSYRLRAEEYVIRSLRARLDDIDLHVAGAAREALHLLQVADEADALVEAVLAEHNVSRRWILLDSLLALADPGDIHRPWPKWAREIAENLPYLMRVYSDDKLKDRRKEVAREAEKRDR